VFIFWIAFWVFFALLGHWSILPIVFAMGAGWIAFQCFPSICDDSLSDDEPSLESNLSFRPPGSQLTQYGRHILPSTEYGTEGSKFSSLTMLQRRFSCLID
jgi:hypothetical protein